MSEFDIFFDEYENKHNCSPEKYECFEAGQQSKQDEIETFVDGTYDVYRSRVGSNIRLTTLKELKEMQL